MEKSFDLRFIHPSNHGIYGPVGAGKTFRMAQIIRNKDRLIKNGAKINNVIWFYSSYQDEYTELKKSNLVTRFISKMPTIEEFLSLTEPYKKSSGSIVVLDDLMGQIDKTLVELVCVKSRHTNVSLFVLFQNIFIHNPLARQISLNLKYFHILKNPRDSLGFMILAKQILSKDFKWLVDVYNKEISKTPYGCLLLNLDQETPEFLRVTSNILPNERPVQVWMKKGTVI